MMCITIKECFNTLIENLIVIDFRAYIGKKINVLVENNFVIFPDTWVNLETLNLSRNKITSLPVSACHRI